MLILVLSVIVIIGIAWAFAYHNTILKLISKIINSIRVFIWDNKSFIDIAFLIIYAVIQLIFIIQINKPETNINFLVILFVLALLTMLSIERIFLKSRFNYLNELFNDAIEDYTILKVKYMTKIGREKQLVEMIKKSKRKKGQ